MANHLRRHYNLPFEESLSCHHRYHQSYAQRMVCVKKSHGISTTRHIEIESKLQKERVLCDTGNRQHHRRQFVNKSKTNKEDYRELRKTRDSNHQELEQRIKEFIEMPQPRRPFSSLKFYKNPMQKLLLELAREKQQSVVKNEDPQEREENINDRLPPIVLNGHAYKSKWVDAREWYYKSSDGICRYLRYPDRQILPDITISFTG